MTTIREFRVRFYLRYCFYYPHFDFDVLYDFLKYLIAIHRFCNKSFNTFVYDVFNKYNDLIQCWVQFIDVK